MKIKIIGALLLITIIGGFWWISNRAFLDISIHNTSAGNIAYTVLSQKNGKTKTTNSNRSQVRVAVNRGYHQVEVSQAGKSYFTVVKTGGFFSSSKINANLAAEKRREFIGDNPAPCMYEIVDVLLSHECNSAYGSVGLHRPATPDQPTHITNLPEISELSVSGFVKVAGADYVLLAKASEGEMGDEVEYTLSRIDQNLNPTNGTVLRGLNSANTYSVVAYKDGVFIHNADLTKTYYYGLSSSDSVDLRLGSGGDGSVKGVGASVFGDSVLATFSTTTPTDSSEHDNPFDKGESEFRAYRDGGVRTFKTRGTFSSAVLCGTDKICAISGKSLVVFDAAKEKLRLLYKISNVASVDSVAGRLLVTTDAGVIAFDADKREGYAEYSFGSYTPCGLRASDTTYVLCLITNKQRKVALRVDPPNDNADSIDKKVAELAELSEVEALSIYKNIIHITPDVGNVVYDNTSGFYDYSPEAVRLANQSIDEEINRLGINRSVYQIKSTIR